MNPKCHICGAEARFFMKKDGFDEYICNRCDFSFVYPQPEAEWLKNEVYSLESGYQANKNKDLSILKEDKVSKKILDFLSKTKPNGNLLDVGSSSGQFMYWARERDFDPKGVEINKRTADIAQSNGLDVYEGVLEDAPFERGNFDAVFIGDVIEHVNDPRSLIKASEEMLKPDGLLIISTPNVDCFWSRSTLILYKLFKIPWTSATPPHHLSQFSVNNLNMLMKEAGFSLIKPIFSKPPSLKYELGSLHLYKKWKATRRISDLLYMVMSFGIYSIMYYLNALLGLFLRKDFRMIMFYAKKR